MSARPSSPFPRRVAPIVPAAVLAWSVFAAAQAPPAGGLPPADDVNGQAAGPQPITRVLEFYVEEEALGVRTALPPTDGLKPIEIAELPGTARVDVTVRSRRDRPGGLTFFKLMHSSPGPHDGAGGAATDTSVLVRPGYVQLSRVVRTGEELSTTNLTQSGDFGKSAAPLADRDDRVSLRVRRVRLATSDVVEDLTRTAPTFSEMLRRSPDETSRHLGPIFRDFRQEAAVFGGDARVAFQVFSDRLPRDPKLVPAVRALVTRLDAGDYREREAAAKALGEMGGPAALVLTDLRRGRLTTEQNSRIDTLLADYHPLPAADAAGRLNDPEFLLNCLTYSDDASIRAAAAGRLAELSGVPLTAPPPSERETRLKLAQQFRAALGSQVKP